MCGDGPAGPKEELKKARLAVPGYDEGTNLALQLRLLRLSESMGHHDSEIMDDGRLD
jgi:hypothetical protein